MLTRRAILSWMVRLKRRLVAMINPKNSTNIKPIKIDSGEPCSRNCSLSGNRMGSTKPMAIHHTDESVVTPPAAMPASTIDSAAIWPGWSWLNSSTPEAPQTQPDTMAPMANQCNHRRRCCWRAGNRLNRCASSNLTVEINASDTNHPNSSGVSTTGHMAATSSPPASTLLNTGCHKLS